MNAKPGRIAAAGLSFDRKRERSEGEAAVAAIVVEKGLAFAGDDRDDPAKKDGVAVPLDDFIDFAVDGGERTA